MSMASFVVLLSEAFPRLFDALQFQSGRFELLGLHSPTAATAISRQPQVAAMCGDAQRNAR